MFVAYVSQGYYGLSLALRKPFSPTFGLGHSPALMSVYIKLTGDTSLLEETYTARNVSDGWDDDYYWSTMITWFANDVGFSGALLVLGLIGLLWGRSWYAATYGLDDRAAIIFCLITFMMFYFPLNNQVFMTFDGYMTFVIWSLYWLFFRGNRPQPRPTW